MSTPPPTSAAGPTTGRQHPTTAIVALVSGILGLTALPLIGSVVALIFGGMSRREVAAAPEALTDDLGRVGRILGWIGIALGALGLLVAVAAVVLLMAV